MHQAGQISVKPLKKESEDTLISSSQSINEHVTSDKMSKFWQNNENKENADTNLPGDTRKQESKAVKRKREVDDFNPDIKKEMKSDDEQIAKPKKQKMAAKKATKSKKAKKGRK